MRVTTLALVVLAPLLLVACQATTASPELEQSPDVAAEQSRLRLDALVFQRTTRYSSVAETTDVWVVEARLAGCVDFAELKRATESADMSFELQSDAGEVVRLYGGTGGHTGDWGDGFEAFIMLHPRDRSWAPRLGRTYRLVPRNSGGEQSWVVAANAHLRL